MAEPRLFDQSSLKPRLEQAFDFVARQVRLTVERTPDYFPIYTVGGRWLHRSELWTDWCGGFHAGMMWLIACRTGDSWWRRTSEHYSGLFEHRQHDGNVHELKHRGKSEFSFTAIGEHGGRIAAGRFKPGPSPQVVIAPGDGVGPLVLYECTGSPTDRAAWTGRNLLERPMIHGHSLQLADIDGDGNLDIIAAEMAKWREQKTEPDHPDATAWVLYGDGQGHFRTSIFSKGIDFHDVRVAELEGDGDLDILDKPYNWEAPRVDVWINEGR